MQVLLVTGGWNVNDGTLKSTEVLEAGGSWKLTSPLPSARYGLKAAVLENKIFVFGENIFHYVIPALIIYLKDTYLQEDIMDHTIILLILGSLSNMLLHLHNADQI